MKIGIFGSKKENSFILDLFFKNIISSDKAFFSFKNKTLKEEELLYLDLIKLIKSSRIKYLFFDEPTKKDQLIYLLSIFKRSDLFLIFSSNSISDKILKETDFKLFSDVRNPFIKEYLSTKVIIPEDASQAYEINEKISFLINKEELSIFN